MKEKRLFRVGHLSHRYRPNGDLRGSGGKSVAFQIVKAAEDALAKLTK